MQPRLPLYLLGVVSALCIGFARAQPGSGSDIDGCVSAGFTSCCNSVEEDCYLDGPACSCDLGCYDLGDCCDDIEQICVQPCSTGEVRLVNRMTGFTAEGEFFVNGTVEICYNEVFGTICGRGWDMNDATVACRQLDYRPPRYEAVAMTTGDGGGGTIWLENVDCIGFEEQVTDCANTTPDGDVSDECRSGSFGLAGVTCTQGSDSDGCVSAGFTSCCDSVVDDCYLVGADCSCDQGCYEFGDCCDDIEQICVQPCSTGEVRLTNGTTGFTAEGAFFAGGTVEICYNEVFGTICGQGWDMNDATVVCRQLNYRTPLYEAVATTTRGGDGGTILLENVDCTGTEEQVTGCANATPDGDVSDECRSGSFGSAGVTCTPVCPFGLFPCASGECVFVFRFCNGESDCGDSSDELNCETNGSRPSAIGGNLFPFGESVGDTQALPRDDGSYLVTLSQAFPYFEMSDTDLYVNTNGILSFGQSFTNHDPRPFPFNSPPLIALFWDDVDLTEFGDLFYRETNESYLLVSTSVLLREGFEDEEEFNPTYLFIATWDNVAQFDGGLLANTFQVVLSTDGERSFALFLYGDLQWGRAAIGFNAGDRTRFLTVPGSLSENITEIIVSTTNTATSSGPGSSGLRGIFAYRIDTPVILPNGIRFEQDTYFVNESMSIEVCAGLNEVMQFGGKVTLSTTELSATGNEDYRAITRDLTFSQTVTRECVEISTFSDNTVEGTEVFFIRLTTAGVEVASAIVFIGDTDDPGVRFLQPVYFVNEFSGITMVCVTTDAQLERNFTLSIQTEEDTATERVDYVSALEFVTFTNDNKMYCMTIEVIDDTADEDAEAFFVSAIGLDVSTEVRASVQITDDDITTFLFMESTYTFGESVGNATVCAMTGTELERTITLNIRTSDITATDGSDYLATFRDVTFNAGNNIRCVAVPILPDQLNENDETFSVILSGAESTILSATITSCAEAVGINETTTNITFATARVTIMDDDVAGVGFEQPVYVIQESQAIATVSAILNVTLDETRIEATAVTEDITATAGSDYSRTILFIAFNSGENQQQFDIRVLTTYSNPNPEGAESFHIVLLSDDATVFLPSTIVVILDTHSFYPFGEEECESTIENLDDASSPLFQLQQSFPFFGENETAVFVSTNGIVSFGEPFIDYQSRPFPLEEDISLIAPFWDDADLRRSGIIYYRETNDSSLLQRAHEQVQLAFPHLWNFFPTALFIATWDRIAQFDSDQEENTFQVVMATDGELSFVFFIYGDIQWVATASIGFNAGDSVRSFSVPQPADSRSIETVSNVGIPGVFIYRVDQPLIITPEDGCTAGEVRLVEGATQGEGVVEVCSGNQWERQCVDESWNDTSASDVCRQLGFLGGVATMCTTINSTLKCVGVGEEPESVSGSGSFSGISGSGGLTSQPGAGGSPGSGNSGITSQPGAGSADGSGSGSFNVASGGDFGGDGSALGSGDTIGSASENATSIDGDSPQSTSDTLPGNNCSYIAAICTEVASVGFSAESYIVREDIGFLNVCVALNQSLERSLTVTLQTVESGTAEVLSDFNATSTVLTFGPAAAEQQECVEIAISDDDTVESNESFLVLLTTVEQAVSLNRQHTFITIIDDDETLRMTTSFPGSFTATPRSFTATSGSLAITSPEPSAPISTPGTTVTPTLGAGTSRDITTALATSLTLGTVAVIILVLAVTLLIERRRRKRRKAIALSKLQVDYTQSGDDIPMTFFGRAQLSMEVTNPYALFQQAVTSTMQDGRSLKELSMQMLIPCRSIRLLDSIGQGEFGIVYKAHLVSGRKRSRGSTYTSGAIELVAVKTLKGFYDQSQVVEMLRESLKMVEFDHPNVLNLIGVCLDGGPAPYIVLPFMANGSLHSYLRKERPNLLLGEEADEEELSAVRKRLLDMCIQIAKGMEYLASKSFVHRDLAARNCMIDTNFVIKVADFGLSENTYTKTYFRQGQDTAVKLPIKWLSLESLNDGVFSEKTDVWAFGVTCWEVFSAGKTPYPGVAPMSLPGLLENGHRLEKPSNTACGDEMYSTMLSCWNTNPKERPPFSELVNRISGILEPLADYIDFSSFGRTQSMSGKVIENTAVAADSEAKTSTLPTISENSESYNVENKNAEV